MPNTRRAIRFWAVLQLSLTAVIALAVCVLAFYSLRTHDALCKFRNDLQVRYENGVTFLSEHPKGIPGISSADIQRSLVNQRATLDSLENLNCQ